MKHVYALIMAGGKGQRIWPASRLRNPKQLLRLWGDKTMLQRTAERMVPLVHLDRTLVITSRELRVRLREQLPKLKRQNLLLEPFGRNTASCIGLAALWLRKQDPDAVMVVLPLDHAIKSKENFHKVLSRAIRLAEGKEALVTLGIVPRFPATGFGYIKLGGLCKEYTAVKIYKAARFTEKPDVKAAQAFICSGSYLWNAGIFVWKASAILRGIERHMPKLYEGLLKIDRAIGTRDYGKVLKREYQRFEDVSIDKGVLEKSPGIFTVFGDLKWDDIGSWSSLDYLGFHDKEKNIVVGENVSIDTRNSILISDKGRLLATIGLEDVIVVQTKDATLVCQKERAQEVKELVKRLRASRRYRKYT